MTFTRRALLIIIAAFTVGCASTPHGNMMMAFEEAPDLETGEGCERFGVQRAPGMIRVSDRPFNPEFVEAWEIEDHCPSVGRGMVWGCYNENTGTAYIVGKDWKVYWHEWCHAKVGRGHNDVRSLLAAL